MVISGRTLQKLVISFAIIYVLISGCVSNPYTTGKGELRFSSSPPGADVFLDSQYRGTTPCTVQDVDTGNHTLEYRLTGYQSWNTIITVPSGSSTFYAALIPISIPVSQTVQVPEVTVSTPSPVSPTVAIHVSENPMIVGSSQVFSGTSSGITSLNLVLFGPGTYTNGVPLAQPKTDANGLWSYTWNPGQAILSGLYTVVAHDAQNTTSATTGFSVVGGGSVSITVDRFTATPGDIITFSGRCTTGAHSVILTLYGPGQLSNGISLGSQSLNTDNTWSYQYTTSHALPSGQYSATVQDEEGTASDSVSFTINAA
jgi:hypothetical protein